MSLVALECVRIALFGKNDGVSHVLCLLMRQRIPQLGGSWAHAVIPNRYDFSTEILESRGMAKVARAGH